MKQAIMPMLGPSGAETPPGPGDSELLREAHRVVVGVTRALVKHAGLFIGLPLAGAVLLGGFALLQPKWYESTVVVGVTRAPSGGAGVQFYRPLLENSAIIGDVIAEFKLGDPPHRLNRTRFLRGVYNVEALRNTELLRLSLILRDPDLAAKVLTRIAERSLDLTARFADEETTRARAQTSTKLTEARRNLDAAEARLLSFRTQSQIELQRRDVESMLQQRGALLPLLVKIDAQRARVSQAESELKGRERVEQLKRTIDNDPALMEAARSAGTTGDALLGLKLTTDYKNPVYESIDGELARNRAELAGFERERDEIVRSRGLGGAKLEALSRLYDLEITHARLEQDYDLAKNVYSQLATQQELFSLQVQGRTSQLTIIDPAYPADRHISRHTIPYTATGFAFGLVLALGILIVRASA